MQKTLGRRERKLSEFVSFTHKIKFNWLKKHQPKGQILTH